jgi:hypothetical protein
LAVVLAGMALGPAASEPASAGVLTDHLQCYEAKDDRQAAKLMRTMRFDLSGSDFDSESCQLGELTRLCTPVAKQLLEPAVPITDFVGDAAAGSYACYKVQCAAKNGPGPHPIVDQFGDRTIELKRTTELCAPVAAAGGGLALAATWTDFENDSDEMPAAPWGDCATQGKDRIQIDIAFDDGTTGSATYSGVSALWNTGKFTGLEPDEASGFLADCHGMHFLYADGTSLPMAWEDCSMAYSSNFDLDYNEENGSHFRATETGWVSAQFTTYCGD